MNRSTLHFPSWPPLLAIAGLFCLGSAEAAELLLSSGDPSHRPRRVLFMGRQTDVNNHHNPAAFHGMIRLPWAERDLRITFSETLADLNPVTLGTHDELFVFGNCFYYVSPSQETAIEQFANAGGGVAAMHVGCWSFPHSARITSIIGGAFVSHTFYQSFTQAILPLAHPILDGLGTYTSFDEPYQFKETTGDRTFLTMRNQPAPATEMTWIRQQGLGKVFYHSGGHDAQTWVQPNFQELMTRGLTWVAKPGNGPAVAGIDRARIGNGGAIAVRAALDGPGGETLDAVFTCQNGAWHRPVLEGETLYDQGSGRFRPAAADAIRVGGQAASPLMTMASTYTDADAAPHWGLWSGKGGLERVIGRDEGLIAWGEGELELAGPPPGVNTELVMNAGGTSVAQVFVTRDGLPDLDTALVRTAPGTHQAGVLLVEGEDPGLPGGPWTCGDLSGGRLSLNGPGHLAAILPGTTGKRLLLDAGTGWTSLLATGGSVPGSSATVVDLREVRLNDAGNLVVAARIDAGAGPVAAILRRVAGIWTAALADGPQPWLGAAESLVLPADGQGCLIDTGSHVWVLAAISDGSGSQRCLLKISPAGAVTVIGREGAPLELAGESVTLTGLGLAHDWSAGPAGIACGRITITPAAGPPRQVLVRWNGHHALPVIESGRVFHGAAGDFTVESFRLEGGGTAEDGKGGFLTSSGEWVATATAAGGGDRLVHGSSVSDLEGDGRDDLLEAALGGDPLAVDGTPLLGIQAGPAGTVTRYLKKTGSAFLYEVEASDDLTAWHTVSADALPAADQSGVPAGFQRMEVVLPGSPGFARIHVSAD